MRILSLLIIVLLTSCTDNWMIIERSNDYLLQRTVILPKSKMSNVFGLTEKDGSYTLDQKMYEGYAKSLGGKLLDIKVTDEGDNIRIFGSASFNRLQDIKLFIHIEDEKSRSYPIRFLDNKMIVPSKGTLSNDAIEALKNKEGIEFKVSLKPLGKEQQTMIYFNSRILTDSQIENIIKLKNMSYLNRRKHGIYIKGLQ